MGVGNESHRPGSGDEKKVSKNSRLFFWEGGIWPDAPTLHTHSFGGGGVLKLEKEARSGTRPRNRYPPPAASGACGNPQPLKPSAGFPCLLPSVSAVWLVRCPQPPSKVCWVTGWTGKPPVHPEGWGRGRNHLSGHMPDKPHRRPFTNMIIEPLATLV